MVGWDVSVPVGWPDRAIGELAAWQRARDHATAASELGLGPSAIEHAIARGRLHRLHRGVYSLLPPRALPPVAAEQAALLACGSAALLSLGGSATLVAANGDELFETVTGSGAFTSATTSVSTFVVTITGGTGRFADVSGTYTDTVSSVASSQTPTSTTTHDTATEHGQISY